MFSLFSVRLFSVLFCFKHVLCLQKKLCTNDEECLINAVIERVYPRFMEGMPGVEPSDPLHLDAFIADLPALTYTLFNATLTGLKNCEFFQLSNRRQGDYTVFAYAVSCPVLTLQAEYDLNGIIDYIPLEGKGTFKIIYENYQISFNGKVDKVQDDKGKLHINLLENTVTLDLKGGVNPEYKNVVDCNQESHNYDNNRDKIIEQMTREFVMDAFMKKFTQNLKNFYKQLPIEDLLFKYVS